VLRAQCAIPVFDGLFDGEDNNEILQLLFMCAHWHGLAKLRMHTDETLALLDEATILLGVKFRRFVNHTCGRFNTRELQREADARVRRAAKNSTTSSCQVELAARDVNVAPILTAVQTTPGYHPPSTTPIPLPGTQQTTLGHSKNPPRGVGTNSVAFDPLAVDSRTLDSATTRRAKTFNLDTYKYHSLGDYTEHIRQYGTTDSYSTEPVCLSRLDRLVTG
jgi:hypothetical protein